MNGGIHMEFTCDVCHCPVGLDEGFFRSVNLRPVAWCRACWLARHSELGIPQQRQAPDEERLREPARERAQRRWLTRR